MPRNIPFRLIYAAKIRAARGLLSWSQGELAERAGVSKQSITRIETGIMDPRFSTMTALKKPYAQPVWRWTRTFQAQ
jgi:predicted transcriptional regulator